jgi:hypothetical protein
MWPRSICHSQNIRCKRVRSSQRCYNGFQESGFSRARDWKPDEGESSALTANWLNLPLRDIHVSEKHESADVIIGPVSADQRMARKQKRLAKPSNNFQMACVSYDSCKRLAASLAVMIYLIPLTASVVALVRGRRMADWSSICRF